MTGNQPESNDYYGCDISFDSAVEMFPDEETSRKWFVARRWNGSIICPHCEVKNAGFTENNGEYTCSHEYCEETFDAKTNTVMEDSTLSYMVWGRAMFQLQDPTQDIAIKTLKSNLQISHAVAISLKNRIRESWDDIKKTFGAFNEQWLINRHQGFVIHMARKYEGSGIEFDDLVSEGNMGIIHAAKTYNPDLGVKFTSFASFYIRKFFNEAIAKGGGPISITANQLVQMRQMRREIQELTDTLGYRPDDETISKKLDISLQKIKALSNMLSYHDSLNDTVYDDNNEEAITRLESTDKTPEDIATHNSLIRWVTELLDELPERNAEVVRMYFGLENRKQMSFREIGQEIGLSGERVRKLLDLSFRKLRTLIQEHDGDGTQLEFFTDNL